MVPGFNNYNQHLQCWRQVVLQLSSLERVSTSASCRSAEGLTQGDGTPPLAVRAPRMYDGVSSDWIHVLAHQQSSGHTVTRLLTILIQSQLCVRLIEWIFKALLGLLIGFVAMLRRRCVSRLGHLKIMEASNSVLGVRHPSARKLSQSVERPLSHQSGPILAGPFLAP